MKFADLHGLSQELFNSCDDDRSGFIEWPVTWIPQIYRWYSPRGWSKHQGFCSPWEVHIEATGIIGYYGGDVRNLDKHHVVIHSCLMCDSVIVAVI